MELDPVTGERVYKNVLIGIPRKNGKTTMCAALGLYLLGGDGEMGAEIACAAGSRDQADMVFGQARQFVEVNPALRDSLVPQRLAILCPSTFGVMKRISAEGGLAMGMNLSGAVIDELHVFEGHRHRELYTAITTSTAAREQPLLVSITTAGWNLETLLGELYSRALNMPNVEIRGKFNEHIIVRDRKSRFLMWWYGAPDDADIENRDLWRAVNPSPAVPMAYLEEQWALPNVSEGEFRRLHLNQWTESEEVWISEAVLRANRREVNRRARTNKPPKKLYPGLRDELRVIPENAPVYVAVDVGITHDTCCVSWSWKDGGKTVTEQCVFSPRREVAHHVFMPGGEVLISIVEEFIVEVLAKRYKVREVAYDPRFFIETAQRLSQLGFMTVEFPTQGQVMLDALQAYYVDAHEKRAQHGGDPIFLAHAAAAAAVKTDRGWRVSKIKSSRPIDALIATVMSHARASAGSRESVYDRRDPFILTMDDDEQYDADEQAW
jgi:phage terminase large subunit-like protein